MARFKLALLSLLLPSILAAPSKRSTVIPCKRNTAAGPYDLGNSTNIYGPTGTGTGILWGTGVPDGILSSQVAVAAPTSRSSSPIDLSGALDDGSDACPPATTTLTSIEMVTQTISPTADAAQTQASGSSAAGSAALDPSAGPYGNATDISGSYVAGPTGTGGSIGTSSGHGHKHKTHHRSKTAASMTKSVIETLTAVINSTSSSSAEASAVVTSASSTSSFVASTSSEAASTSSDAGIYLPQPMSSLTGYTFATGSSSASASSSLAAAGGPFQASSSVSVSSSASTSPSQASSAVSAPAPPKAASTSSPGVSSVASSSQPVYSAPPSSSAAVSSEATLSPSTPVSSVAPSTSSGLVLPSPASSGAGKRGLAYNNGALTTCFTKSTAQLSWAYNWASATTGLSTVFEYVPMLWGLQSYHTSGWEAAANAALASGSKHFLSFNEPDLGSQANLSPAQAAAGHMKHLQPFAGRARLSSPSITNGGAPSGLTWLGNFLNACSGCTIDFVPIHWYDSATNVAYFKAYVTSAIAAAKGRPIWITEFGASGSQAQQVKFLQEVMPWLDGQAGVERYAYFGVFDGTLVSGGNMSPLGQTFATFT